MSQALSLFFADELPTEELARWLAFYLGLMFREGEKCDYYSCRYLWHDIYLMNNRFTELEGCNISHLNYELCISSVRFDVEIDISAFTMMGYILLAERGVDEAVLIYDGQAILAKYARCEAGFIDELSGAKVKFPQHIVDVCRRWREAYRISGD